MLLSLPVLIPGYAVHTWLTPDGETLSLDGREVGLRLHDGVALVCHAPLVAKRLHSEIDKFADVLTLFAFVRPARWAVPTPRGLAEALGLAMPTTPEDQALILVDAVSHLMQELAAMPDPHRAATVDHLWLARAAGWLFAEPCLQALGYTQAQDKQSDFSALKIWKSLPKWEDSAPPGRPGNAPIYGEDAVAALNNILSSNASEDRPEQRAYAAGVAPAFSPAHDEAAPALVLAEAGTGVGKTLGYLAPASAWRQKNLGPIWLSTYTRNLQHQLDQELDKLYPNPAIKEQRVVIRKGRENYLCLLNMEEKVNQVAQGYRADIMGLILMARWTIKSRAGEMIGGDCPGWLRELAGLRLTQDLSVRRGECWHGACPHYGACFAERMARKSPYADIVVANHAFVMSQTLINTGEIYGSDIRPTHFVFDEGHHLFDAADNAYAGSLSGLETRDLRRWILGSERSGAAGFSGRARGLRKRLEDLADADSDLNDILHDVERAAQILPSQGWYGRLTAKTPKGPVEFFLLEVANHVYTRSSPADQKGGFSLEIQAQPITEALSAATDNLSVAIQKLRTPLKSLSSKIRAYLEDQESDSDQNAENAENAAEEEQERTITADQRQRLGGIANSIQQRAVETLTFFNDMLHSLKTKCPDHFVDWFEVTRHEGVDVDVAYNRRFIDPTEPFMGLLSRQVQGALITSATLTDQTGVAEVDWHAAEAQTGTRHLSHPPVRISLQSPYDYAAQSRVFIVTDLERDKPQQATAAMAKLFQCSSGGGLGLFTSIQRLKSAYSILAPKLEAKGLMLLAQHVDAMDISTLIDIFRNEPDACLLGTDALRDGVDVPGNALRLLVLDRVPWPRPTIAHRARRKHFGSRGYDDRLTRLRLRQAFGRLIRQKQDRGAFVILDSRLPSRLHGAFPQGVVVERLSLKDTLTALKAFYAYDAL